MASVTVRRTVAIIRGTANVALGVGAVVLLIAFAMHWPPATIAPLAWATLVAFLVSFFSIIIENRLTDEDADDAEVPA